MHLRKLRSGFSLLAELMIGFALLATVAVLMLEYLPTSDRSALEADRVAHATQLAHALIEKEAAKSYSDSRSYAGESNVQHARRRDVDLMTRFTYSVQVTEPNAGQQVKNVKVTVNWVTQGKTLNVHLETRRGTQW